jgi:hypothetical protein
VQYDGQWENDSFHGKGKYYWEDGRVYEGERQNDKKHGKGKMILSSGWVQYDGPWLNDKKKV